MDSKQTGGRPAQILLVEDNHNDVELTRVAFEMSKLPFRLHHVKDGVDCMAFLRKEGECVNVPTPDLILLDLNMPRKNGREVLTEMMADETLGYLRVVVLSTSSNDDEILKMYKLGCSSYIIKPVDFERFLVVVRSLAEYWFTVVMLPPKISTIRPTVRLGASVSS
jgi:two-component system, chemotaxis family, response regulator Rcp1